MQELGVAGAGIHLSSSCKLHGELPLLTVVSFLPFSSATSSLEVPSPSQSLWHIQPQRSPPILTDALVHVGVAGIKVSRWAGWQADAHLADVVPFQQDEELG